MLEVKSLDDVMKHFMMIFITYIVLFSIIIINFIKALYLNKKTKYKDNRVTMVVDLIIDIVCGFAMLCGLMFMGILADNNALNWNYWNKWLWFISAASFTIFIIKLGMFIAKKFE